MRKITRKGLIRKLDRLMSQKIIKRDGQCVVCGTTFDLTNGHLFSRSNYSTRWDELNCHCQCRSCNYRHEFDPYPFTRWFQKKYGMKVYDQLYTKHVQISKLKQFELQELVNKLNENL